MKCTLPCSRSGRPACTRSRYVRVCVCACVYNVSVFLPSWTEPKGRESSLSPPFEDLTPSCSLRGPGRQVTDAYGQGNLP